MFSLISSYTLSALSLFGIPVGHLLDCTLSYWLLSWSFSPQPFPPLLQFGFIFFLSCQVYWCFILHCLIYYYAYPINFSLQILYFSGEEFHLIFVIMSPISFPIKFIVYFKYLNIIKYTCFKSIYFLLPLSLSFLIIIFASWILYIMNVPFLNVWILLKFF